MSTSPQGTTKDDIRKEVLNLKTEFENFKSNVKSYTLSINSEISDLKSQIKFLKKKIVKLSSEDPEQYIRKISEKIVNCVENHELLKLKEILMEEAISVNDFIVDKSGNSDLALIHLCVKLGLNEFVRYLISIGADLNLPDRQDRWTPIMYAVQSKNYELVKLLMSRGVDLNLKDIDGFTPAAIAVDTGDFTLIKLIFEKNPPKKEEITKLMEIAFNNNDLPIKKFLEEFEKSQLTLTQ